MTSATNEQHELTDYDGPVFTQAEEEKEKADMTEAEKEEAEAAICGQVHPHETPEGVSSSLAMLDEELARLPAAKRAGWEQAKERCPDLVGDRHRLMFLRCEVFNVELAAIRLTKYWDKRIELFGPDKAFLPLTLGEALRDDGTALSVGFLVSTERTDSAGRRIVFGDPSKLDRTKYARESMVRAFWYAIHAALEDETTQKRGVIMMVSPRRASIRNFDRRLLAMNAESVKGALPVRVGAFHICHPPGFFAAVFPILKFFLGKRLRARIKVHAGSDEHVLDRLGTFGIPKDNVPSDLGGNAVLDQELWLEDRRNSGL